MSQTSEGQVSKSAAEIYDAFFLPALFNEWPTKLCDSSGMAPGQNILDIACGTGVLAMEALKRVGPEGSVVGLDLNPDMLTQARSKSDEIDWVEGPAEQLPFENEQFDHVVCQFGLMFFENRAASLAEIKRVLKPGGSMVVAVWAELDLVPGYSAMVALLDRLFGSEIAGALHAPYCLGNSDQLRDLFNEAGIDDVEIVLTPGSASFPSISDWVHTDIKGWTLSEMINDTQYSELKSEAESALIAFVQPDGSVQFDHPALIVTAVM